MMLRGKHVSLPRAGEVANGDRAVLRTDGIGRALFGVIDGLGHGPDAETASVGAAAFLEGISLETPLERMMEQLHGRLSGTRGAAATVCLLKGAELEVCAVGNVELRSADLRFPLIYSAGILGVSVRKFRVCSARLEHSVRFVAFSDGISSRTRTEDVRRLTPAEACHFIMNKYRRDTDDATVLVADLG
jgi:phosphoserine phosphatase RsbX